MKSVNPRIVGIGAGSEEEDDYLYDYDGDISDLSAPVGAGIPHHLLAQPGEWHPLYLLSKFKDTESRDDRCAVAILLPSGVHEHPERIKVEIGRSSKLRVTTPGPLRSQTLQPCCATSWMGVV